jgi:hypothetical protein
MGVAAEVLGGKLPVARLDPFIWAGDHFDAALAALQEIVDIPRRLSEIFQ